MINANDYDILGNYWATRYLFRRWKRIRRRNRLFCDYGGNVNCEFIGDSISDIQS